MEFIFKDVTALDTKALNQGDVIARSDEVVDRIRQAHQYYADTPEYSHFVVLTQSCDLVKRRDEFKAPYITIAAAKPFKNTIQEFLDGKAKRLDDANFYFHTSAVIRKVKQLLERYIHNTEPEHFFLPKSGHPNLPDDLVVFLRLTIALRKEHYDTLASAKIAELADVFQAKLGWLKGNIYSRVATPDIEERVDADKIKTRFYDQYIPKDKVHLSVLQTALLRRKVKAQKETLARVLSADEVLDLIEKEIPEDTIILADSIVERLKKNKLFDATDEELTKRFARTIANTPNFKSVVKSNTG